MEANFNETFNLHATKMLKDFIYEIYNLNETQNNIFQDLKCSIAFHFLFLWTVQS